MRISISVILLIFLFKQVDKKSLLEVIKSSNKPVLFLAFCVFFLTYVLCIYRWEMLLGALKISLPFKRVVISYAGGIFFSLFLPSTIGGDLMRSVDLATHTQRPKEVIATVFLDRLSGYAGLVILALLSLLLGWRWQLIRDESVIFSIIAITAILIAILFVLFNKFLYSKINNLLHSPNSGKIRELLKNLHQEIHYFRQHKKIIINNLILSIIIQAIAPVTFYMVAKSLHININIIYFFIFLPIIGAITLLPISIGGLGLRDASTIYFFAKVGIARDLAFAMSLLSFFFLLIGGIAGGIIYVLTVHHRRLQYHKTPLVRTHK
jgi:uncharacterized protein (TIRG00374 family)